MSGSAHQTAMAPFVGEHVAHETPVRLHLAMTGAEGCAVRALGVIIRRGWYLQAAELHAGQPGEARTMTVDVLRRDATRHITTLKSQLERLFDMEAVTIVDAAEPARLHEVPASAAQGGRP